MKKKLWWILLLVGICILGVREQLQGAEVEQGISVEAVEGQSYLKKMEDAVDFSKLDEFLEDGWDAGGEKISFSELVRELLAEGITGFDFNRVTDWLSDALWYEISANRKLLIEVVILAVGFSILRSFSNAFRSSYVSELCFLLVYCVLAVMLLQSFLSLREIVSDVLEDSVMFMQALVPSFCLTMVFSSGIATSAGFYQLAFLAIYIIQWLFLTVLLPCIHVYVVLEIFNHFFEDEKFENLTGMVQGFICWAMKITVMIVLGLNVVQGMISPAKDRLSHGTVQKAATLIPGIGNVVNGVSELLLGSGILLKNCVGVAGLIALLMIGVIPVAKIACMTFFYKLAAVVTEPVTDKRIAGCLKGMAEGGVLYLKLIVYCLVLFFLTIALTAAASSFMY